MMNVAGQLSVERRCYLIGEGDSVGWDRILDGPAEDIFRIIPGIKMASKFWLVSY